MSEGNRFRNRGKDEMKRSIINGGRLNINERKEQLKDKMGEFTSGIPFPNNKVNK